MGVFGRLFKVTQAEAHAVVDKFEDPIKMTEQGIRDLKKNLQEAMTALAEVKGMAIRTRRDAENNRKLTEDYERKAMLLLQKMQKGELEATEAERLATEALSKKEQAAAESNRLSQEAERHEKMAAQLQANVNKIKSSITTYENDLVTLRARAKTAAATKKINRQISKVDTAGTVSMLEKMKAKVEEDESLAAAYGEMAAAETRVEDEIDAALSSGTTSPGAESLEALKKKMGITEST